MDTKDIGFLILPKTKFRPQQVLSHPTIVWDLKVPRPDSPSRRVIVGIIVARNAKLTTTQDFN